MEIELTEGCMHIENHQRYKDEFLSERSSPVHSFSSIFGTDHGHPSSSLDDTTKWKYYCAGKGCYCGMADAPKPANSFQIRESTNFEKSLQRMIVKSLPISALKPNSKSWCTETRVTKKEIHWKDRFTNGVFLKAYYKRSIEANCFQPFNSRCLFRFSAD